MNEMEILVFLLCGFFAVEFLKKWYRLLFDIWPPERNKVAKSAFAWLPFVPLAVYCYTLKALASFDVVNDIFFIIFYIVIGYAWLYLGLILMSFFFDLSWIDDALNMNNKAALISVTGGFLGLTIIYSGANIGDGPGWWCVFFAGGLGLTAWILLALLTNTFTQVFERITVERDTSCGIRFGFYLLASGIILGRASAGDWTSFSMTIVEFMDGWPALPFTALAIMTERHYIYKAKMPGNTNKHYLYGSILWGIVYVVIAVVSIIMLPSLNENPLYSVMSARFVR